MLRRWSSLQHMHRVRRFSPPIYSRGLHNVQGFRNDFNTMPSLQYGLFSRHLQKRVWESLWKCVSWSHRRIWRWEWWNWLAGFWTAQIRVYCSPLILAYGMSFFFFSSYFFTC